MNPPDAPAAASSLPELSLADLAAELAALRARVAKLEGVVTFWKHPDTGVEKAIVRCEAVRCDRLQIEGKKPGAPEGPRLWTGILMECG